MKFKSFKGQTLLGDWVMSYKIDGVHAIFKNGLADSKRGKPLHNLGHLNLEGRYEIFKNDWSTSVSMVRTLNSKPIPLDCCYSLDPPDPRLVISTLVSPSEDEIAFHLEAALALGYEGLILNQGTKYYKVKPVYSVDVKVLGLQEGTGQHIGKLGAFITEYGKVGTGLKDKEREELWDESIVGELIEVEFMEFTSNGKFRHPRFIRLRWDKDEENLEND